ncbi:hypothetical protein E2C01_051208 [Portunus trituberculatus]|uniref:Uncharacterized protein n=1 Tax=Portunus trituberculatus TaxID=210409 RepID=A0A5B7GAY5_PORTR|nr:hypothetical protein [Portunus trituberculatus]
MMNVMKSYEQGFRLTSKTKVGTSSALPSKGIHPAFQDSDEDDILDQPASNIVNKKQQAEDEKDTTRELVQNHAQEVSQNHTPEVPLDQASGGIQSHSQGIGFRVTQGHILVNDQDHLSDTVPGLVLEVSLDHITRLNIRVVDHIPEEGFILTRGQEAETWIGMVTIMRGLNGINHITSIQGLRATTLIGFEDVEDLEVGGVVLLLEVIVGDTRKKKAITGGEIHQNHSVNRNER